MPPLAWTFLALRSAYSLALLRMRARMSARVAASKCVGGDPTNAYLYCVYALVGGAISVRDLYVPFHKSVRTIERIALCLPQARCLCSENGALGINKLLYIYYTNYDDFECHSVKRPPRYNRQLDLAPR